MNCDLTYVRLTDVEGGHEVAVNLAAIEVVEAKSPGETWINTRSCSVVVAGSIDEVLDRIRVAFYSEDVPPPPERPAPLPDPVVPST